MKSVNQSSHRFLDEAGDTTFYGKGKINIVGTNGVSSCFVLGMLKLKEPLSVVRDRIHRQSILKQAFAGQLVTTPIDGPAFWQVDMKDSPAIPAPAEPFYGGQGDQLTLF